MRSQVIRFDRSYTRETGEKVAPSRGTAASAQPHGEDAKGTDPADFPTSPKFVRRILAARASRRHFFNGDLFADPAWDILLELYALHCEQRRTSVSKLCIAAAVPGTTALRWLDKLQSDDLLIRHEDPLDRRRVWVSISPRGVAAMRRYLDDLAPASMPI